MVTIDQLGGNTIDARDKMSELWKVLLQLLKGNAPVTKVECIYEVDLNQVQPANILIEQGPDCVNEGLTPSLTNTPSCRGAGALQPSWQPVKLQPWQKVSKETRQQQ